MREGDRALETSPSASFDAFNFFFFHLLSSYPAIEFALSEWKDRKERSERYKAWSALFSTSNIWPLEDGM